MSTTTGTIRHATESRTARAERSGRRALRRTAVVTTATAAAVGCALAALPAPALAADPVVVHERWVEPLDGLSLVCGGVQLDYSGRVRTTIHVVEQPSGGFHVSVTWNTMGVTGVAPDGTVYRDVSNGSFSKNATEEWVSDDDSGAFTENVHERIRVFAPGGDSVLLTRVVQFHITKVDGDLKLVRDEVTETCGA